MATHLQRHNGSPEQVTRSPPSDPSVRGSRRPLPRELRKGGGHIIVDVLGESRGVSHTRGSIAGFPESILIRELIPSTIHTTIQAVGKGTAVCAELAAVPTGSCKGPTRGSFAGVGPSNQ